MTHIDEAFSLLSRADDYLRYAETTRRSEIFGPAVSMAYYAAYYAALAVVAYHREGPKTHKGTRSLFGKLAVRESDFPGEVSRLLEHLADGRIKADYDFGATRTWTDSQAADAISRAQTFVREVEAWFGRHHVPDTP